MVLPIIFISIGFLGGTFLIAYVVLSIKNRDDLLIRDLLDRLIADSPGDYLNLVYQREKLGMQKEIPWYRNFSFKPLTKTPLPPEVPTVGQLEMDHAKKKAAEEAKKQESDIEEFERQQAERFRDGRDTVIP